MFKILKASSILSLLAPPACAKSFLPPPPFPPKELRGVIDQGKKDIKNGIVVSISTFEGKVGVAVGLTKALTKEFDAVELVKMASKVLGGRGDFAQAGGSNKDKIEEAFKTLNDKIS